MQCASKMNLFRFIVDLPIVIGEVDDNECNSNTQVIRILELLVIQFFKAEKIDFLQ